MKIQDFLLIGVAPVILMSYGWYLGQLHQSGYDIAGIFLFITGLVGLVVALLLNLFTRKYSFHGKWFTNLLLGGAGCGIIFVLVFIFVRLHG
jgi:hypothetical protein